MSFENHLAETSRTQTVPYGGGRRVDKVIHLETSTVLKAAFEVSEISQSHTRIVSAILVSHGKPTQ